GLSSSTNLLTEASQQTQALIFSAAARVGRLSDAMHGTIMNSKQGIQDFARGMESVLAQFGVSSMEAIDQLSDETKMRLNIQLKAAFGMELGEIRSALEVLKEAGKTFADRLDDINKKRQQNLTLEEKAALA